MTIPERAADEAIRIAQDNSYGYDQANRWGPDSFDCSSLVIHCYKDAGVPLTSTYTGNMKKDFLAHGFKDVKSHVNLATGAGLQKGDVLLNEQYHTAMYVGDGKLVHATGNENGGVTGGKPGDQTGREICVAPYFNHTHGWDYVLRYEGPDSGHEEAPGTYTVKQGDSLWSIAMSHGTTVAELCRLNNLDPNKYIYPGQVLKLAPDAEDTEKPTADDGNYTVKPGDSLWQIAQDQLGNGWCWPKIASANNIEYPYIIHPGDRLKIPREEK
jgi:LysM repeat protein